MGNVSDSNPLVPQYREVDNISDCSSSQFFCNGKGLKTHEDRLLIIHPP